MATTEIDPRMVKWDNEQQPTNAATIDPSMVKWGVNLPSFDQSYQEELASRNPLEKYNAGWGAGMNRAALGLKGMFTNLTPQDQQVLSAGQQVSHTWPGLAGSASADMSMLTAPSMGISNAAHQIPSVVGRTAANVAGQAALGGGYGALTTPEDRKTGAIFGAGGGALGGAAEETFAGLARPAAGTAAARLAQEGVPLTPGQSAGGFLKKFEDSLRTWAPIVGERQKDATDQWSVNAVNKTLPPGATPIAAAPGTNIIKEAADRFDSAYKQAYGSVGPIKADQSLSMELTGILTNLGPKLTKTDAYALAEQLARVPGEFKANGTIDGQAMKDLRASYQRLATDAFNGGNGRLGQAYSQVADSLDNLMVRQYPNEAAVIDAIDSKYSNFLALQKAAGKAGNEEGTFAPGQVKQSIKEMDKTKDKRAFARDTTKQDLRDTAQQGIDVLGPTIPPVGPGTAEKLGPMVMMANPLTTLPYAAAAGLYTRPAQNILMGRTGLQQGILSGLGPAFSSAPIAGVLASPKNKAR